MTLCLTVSDSAAGQKEESVLAGDYFMTAAFIIVHMSSGTGYLLVDHGQ